MHYVKQSNTDENQIKRRWWWSDQAYICLLNHRWESDQDLMMIRSDIFNQSQMINRWRADYDQLLAV